MGYEIVYKRSVAKDLNRIPQEQQRRIMARIEADLAETPEKFPALKGDRPARRAPG